MAHTWHYARVSTRWQSDDIETQKLRLMNDGPVADFSTEEIRPRDEPQRSCLHDLIPSMPPGSQVWATHLSRYGTGSRLQELIALAKIHDVELHCLTGTITELTADDIGTRIALAVLLEVGQDDLEEHRARIRAGRERARAEGRSLGGPEPKITDARIAAWVLMRNQGQSLQQIADTFGVSKSTVKRGFKRYRED